VLEKTAYLKLLHLYTQYLPISAKVSYSQSVRLEFLQYEQGSL